MVEVDALLRPDLADTFDCIIDCKARFSNGAEQPRDPAQVRSDLLALEGGASVTGTDPDGNSITVNVVQVGDVEFHKDESEGGIFFLHVLLRERN